MLSLPHLVIIFLVALVVLGPEKLPEVARTLGKMMAQFRRVTGDFRSQIEGEMRDLERQAHMKELEEYRKKMAEEPHPVPNEVLDPVGSLAAHVEPSPEPPAEPATAEQPTASHEPVHTHAGAPEKPSDGDTHSG